MGQGSSVLWHKPHVWRWKEGKLH